MTAQIKVKIFVEVGQPKLLEKTINTWIEENSLGPADILKVSQSECGDDEQGQVTISVWYIPQSVGPKPKLSKDEISIFIEDQVPF